MSIIESERLLLKPLSLNHLSENYVKWLNDEEVYRYMDTGGNYTFEMLKNYLTGVDDNSKILFWGIHLKGNDKHIGNIKIDPLIERHGLGEYGIMIGDKTEWGKGYAKEASNLVIKYCFEIVKLRKITLGVVVENITAVELYSKLGFVKEGYYKKHGIYRGTYCDIIRMSLFNKSF